MSPQRALTLSSLCLIALLHGDFSFAQQESTAADAEGVKQSSETKIPEVPEQPITVDPTTVLPQLVTKKGTVTFEEVTLLEVAKWLQEKMQIPVVFEEQTINFSLEFGPTVTDRLDDAPVYQLLNRLQILGLRWNVSDGVLYFVGEREALKRMVTVPYNLGDLLDAGYLPDDISRTIRLTIHGVNGEHFDEYGEGNSSLVWLGDVLFVRHTHALQRQVQGLFESLRHHGRRTFIYDPAEHENLRNKLDSRLSVDFQKLSLTSAIETLSQKTGTDIRFNPLTIKEFGNRLRSPITLTLKDQKLQTILRALLREFSLSVILEDGVISISTEAHARGQYKTAVYFVKDLCQTQEETVALMNAISRQTQGEAVWYNENLGDDKQVKGGVIVFARVGTMVVRQWEKTHWQISSLLENYRSALRQSKQRARPGSDPKEIITRYYKLHTVVAEDLEAWIPLLVEPESWEGGKDPAKSGSIINLSSTPDSIAIVGGATQQKLVDELIVPAISKSVLIIKHRREVHEQIDDLIRRVTNGDNLPAGGFGGQGSGGFGGGFF